MKTHQRRGLSLALIAGLASSVIMLSGCAADGPTSGNAGAPVPAAPQGGAVSQEDRAVPANAPEAPGPQDGRKIARSASVSVVVEDIKQASKPMNSKRSVISS